MKCRLYNNEDSEAKSILSKTRIPIADYVINPYVGCIHSFVFCYARFMKKFTGTLSKKK